jgi:hypothetical protein
MLHLVDIAFSYCLDLLLLLFIQSILWIGIPSFVVSQACIPAWLAPSPQVILDRATCFFFCPLSLHHFTKAVELQQALPVQLWPRLHPSVLGVPGILPPFRPNLP